MISNSEREALAVGLKQVKRALNENRAGKVFLAKDCDAFLLAGLEELCKNAGITPCYVETMKELGTACGIDVKASCACVC